MGVADGRVVVQAPVVGIGGTTRRRDGSAPPCITWSLADGREAVESNGVIRDRGWTAAGERNRVRLEPKVFSWG